MDKRTNRFNKWEIWLFRMHLGMIGLAVALFGIIQVFNDQLRAIAEALGAFVTLLFFVAAIYIPLTIIRLIRYLVVFKGKEGVIGIKRTVITLFTGPISALAYYILFFVMALALSSCEFSG